MKLFDPEKTTEVKELLSTRAEFRDDLWFEKFFSSVIAAEFWGTTTRLLKGEDNFPYLALFTDKREDTPEQISIADILPLVTENGLGVVINPHKIQPDWIFTYGHLWSLREYGTFFVTDQEELNYNISSDDEGIFVAQPEENTFPLYARVAIKRFLAKHYKITDPQVMLLIDPRENPSISFVFSVFASDFKEDGQFEKVLQGLDWHLLPHYGLRTVSKDSELQENFSLF